MDKQYFDKVWDRWGKDAIKWDLTKMPDSPFYTEVDKEDVIPMWVADMDFATAPSVVEALKERVDHPLYGYFMLPDRYIEAVKSWQEDRFGVSGLKRENIMYQNSVLGGIATFVYAYSQPGDNILVNQATYTGFQGTVKNAGRFLVYSELKKDEEGIYRLDLADMEEKIIKNNISLYIFCSPHNPTGRVWTKEELQSVVDLCEKHNVFILSDEIWADFLVEEGKKHIPIQSISDVAKKIAIGLYAPSKTFNLAGLVGAYSVIHCPVMNQKITKMAGSSHYNMLNVFSVHALIGAYEGGAEYVDVMNKYIRENQKELYNFFTNECKGISTHLPEGTYLLWVDIKDTGIDMDTALTKLKQAGIIVNDGRTFHGQTHLRFNLACPNIYVKKVIEKMREIFPSK